MAKRKGSKAKPKAKAKAARKGAVPDMTPAAVAGPNDYPAMVYHKDHPKGRVVANAQERANLELEVPGWVDNPGDAIGQETAPAAKDDTLPGVKV